MDKWYPASGIAVPCFRNCGTRKLEWRCNLGRILHWLHASVTGRSESVFYIRLVDVRKNISHRYIKQGI